jgi:hydrogenase maturation protease
MTGGILVAGVGNVFLGDDGFGVEVVHELARLPIPAGVEVTDFGIRGVHLAYRLLDGCELLILVDASSRGVAPGTVSVLQVDLPDPSAPPASAAEPDPAAALTGPVTAPVMDPHGLAPDQVFALLGRLGGRPCRTLVVACEPADLGDGMDLSAPVRAAVPHAVRTVLDLVDRELAGSPTGSAGSTGTVSPVGAAGSASAGAVDPIGSPGPAGIGRGG